MSGSWRFRSCPRCRAEFASTELRYVGTYRPGWSEGTPADRSCPRCGHTAPTSQFEVTRDLRTGYVRDTDEWRAEWQRVLASKPWRELRAQVIREQRFRCAECGAFGGSTRSTLELHHLHYRTLGRETAADVVALCRVCHSNADIERSRQGRSAAASALWGARLNGWAESVGYGEADDAVEAAFEAWLGRRGEV